MAIDMKKLGFKLQDPIDPDQEHLVHDYTDDEGTHWYLSYVPDTK